MAYSFITEVPIDAEMYGEVRAGLGDETPEGLVVHVVQVRDGGLRYVDVWESEEAWNRFHSERLDPVVGAVLARHGIVPDPSMVRHEVVEVIDTWSGQALVV